MDQTLGLLGSGSGGGGSGGGPGRGGAGRGGLSGETVSTNLVTVERNYMAISSEGSSCYENEAEIELGLGLSLGSNKRHCSDNNVRILTAKDLPNGLSGTKRAAADSVSSTGNANPSTGMSQVVGWPPIRAYRINSLVNQSKISNDGNEKKKNLKSKTIHGNQKKKKNDEDSTNEKGGGGGYLGFIKVNVDGIPIGRKVDLRAHSCYESLAESLADMFFDSIPTIYAGKEQSRQPLNLLDESSEFVLTYEDKEGDWMLVGDVPWRMFLCCVKRLRIMRKSESNEISPNIPKMA